MENISSNVFVCLLSMVVGSNVIPSRQADSHPHGAFAFRNFVYVPDLGADKIWHFKVFQAN
jgi:6-phosphogluconolactonase (cycloisomerase 2 family)